MHVPSFELPDPETREQTSRRGLRRLARPAVTVVVAFATFALIYAAGGIDSTIAALIDMGFDPDRAALITALIVGLVAAGTGTFATGLRLPAAVAGAVTFVVVYAETFAAETAHALRASGGEGAFSLSGWLLTLDALVVAMLVVAWAGPTLALDARRAFLSASAVAVSAARSRNRSQRGIWKPAAAVVLIVALVAGLPVFSTLVNYTPDSLMLSGHSTSTEAPAVPVGARGSGSLQPGATPGAAPWLASVPAGSGTVQTLTFTAPWGGNAKSSVSVYLPPGYTTSGSLRYDTIYEVPWTIAAWVNGTNIVTLLDSEIDTGRIPPTIVVFINVDGAGPFPDSECVDSYDGRNLAETYIMKTVVPAIDTQFRTLAKPAARTIFGFSQGAFCASMLQMRHPDVFGNSVSLFGYYHAAAAAPPGGTARLPFGGNTQLIASHSPILLAPKLPASTIHQLYAVLVGSETAQFYGPELSAYEHVLQNSGYAYDVIGTGGQHSWVETRSVLPQTLDALFSHLAQSGVYAGVYR